MNINRLLVANRGEIACRIMRTARQLGIETVAVYSEADRTALHVTHADHAICIGPSAPAESYLRIDKIIEAAAVSGSDAIHPGYGFLSENAAFARACASAGLVFIGPSPEAIDLMGDKARAKRAMIEAGVPCVPGYQGQDQAANVLADEAAKIGYPLMIKAAAGGGGRGMRLVSEAAELEDAIDTARAEAVNAFGSGELILEKAIKRARHVEFQVFGDQQGTILHLGERDCSIQRRHQKVIEEAPCPVMTDELRGKMGEAAVAAAAAVNYVGAGTIEFLLGEDQSYYFLEMNTRLQVEHPVTEAITGLDLVELQLKVAAGDALGLRQEDIRLSGHAIEARLYAEDPCNSFLPSTGQIVMWQPPEGPGIRVDAGVTCPGEVSPYYDPMIAKVIAKGSSRDEARRRLIGSLARSSLVGPVTNRDFLINALQRPAFIHGSATTAFIEETWGDAGFRNEADRSDLAIAAVTQFMVRNRSAQRQSPGVNPELLNWSSTASLQSVSIYNHQGSALSFIVSPRGPDAYVVEMPDNTSQHIDVLGFDEHRIKVALNNQRRDVAYHASSDDETLSLATASVQFTVRDIAAGEALNDSGGDGMVRAPMHGQLLEIFVTENESVTKGQRIALLEAMKMQHEIIAEVSGRVSAIHLQPATQVAMDTIILEIEPAA